jgi:leucine dehydrogenase
MGGGASAFTALSVRRGIEAAVKFKLGKDNLAGIHVAIQGAGNVSYSLVKELISLGAQLTLCDIHAEKIELIRQEFNIQVVNPKEIYSLACDVFAPCALGGVLNAMTIPTIKAPIIAGAANNQLATPSDGLLLHSQNILYAPDFVVNAGGLIYAAAMYNKETEENKIRYNTEAIYNTVMSIFTKAQQDQQATSYIADELACTPLS